MKLSLVSQNRGLTPINETSKEAKEPESASSSIFSWLFQHTTQIIELALRILFTKQIEGCIGKPDEMKVF